ncbi:TetR/AcrR family transcriptional regulator [Ectobacillus panaciterrae]|uniref:TetR/AcrR family transcriptional regulator n=1 Tax=Ectobacillus panaciterrae TaxID=363872 RepID=UPI000412EB2E|nr:TetR/AcrR family transcriptional regulator [Ectobacillus panaciterrae]
MNERRQKIIEEAAKLLAQKGYHATSIQDIVEQSGMSKGSFYNYFQSKDELILSIFKHQQEEMMERMFAIEQNELLNSKEVFMEQIKVNLENLYAHKKFIHMQMTDMALQKNEAIYHFLFKMRAHYLNWLCKRLTEVYGTGISKYALDCATILTGMIKEYFFYIIIDRKEIELEQIVPFIFRRLDAIVSSFSEDEEPLLDEKLMKEFIHFHEMEKEAHQKHMLCLIRHINRKIGLLELDKKLSEKMLSSLHAFEQEFFHHDEKPREYIAEGLLLYLKKQGIPELEKELDQLAATAKMYF